MTKGMKQARDEKARTYGYNNAIYIDKAMLNKEGYQYFEEKPAKDFKEGTDWYRNNVWHPASQKPSGSGKMLYLGETGAHLTVYPPHFDWNDGVERHIIQKWAWLEDILPDENSL